MKKKILLILILGISTSLIIPTIAIGQIQYYNNTMFDIELYDWDTVYFDYFDVSTDDWDTGSKEGPDLWHVTSVDSFSGDNSFGCFDENNRHYVNNMNFNYLIFPTLSMEGALDMVLYYQCKYITRDSNDYWGIAFYDPATDTFLSNKSFYGFSPSWSYNTFNIKSAYDYWYQSGYFRNNDGSRSYDLRVGFVFIETDNTGFTNDIAESHEIYWSGIFLDDIEIRRLIINDPPNAPNTPIGPDLGRVGIYYEFSTKSTDPEAHDIRYGWDWNNDNNVDEWTNYSSSDTKITTLHKWFNSGTYNVKVIAEDTHGLRSDFSQAKTITISFNNPPNEPTCNYEKENDEIVISAIDPDDDKVRYGISWSDDRNVDQWTEYVLSGTEKRIDCIDKKSYVGVIAEDEYGDFSNWISIKAKNKFMIFNQFFNNFLQIRKISGQRGVIMNKEKVEITLNHPPDKPVITEDTNRKVDTLCGYSIVTTDPDGDDVSHYIMWADDSILDWTSYNPSGLEYYTSHKWVNPGTYTIHAKAKDIYNFESIWTTFQESITKQKSINNIPQNLIWLFEYFPFLQPYF